MTDNTSTLDGQPGIGTLPPDPGNTSVVDAGGPGAINSEIGQIADAVAGEIAGRNWPVLMTVERTQVPILVRKTLTPGIAKCFVLPIDVKPSILTRGKDAYAYPIGVAIAYPLPDGTNFWQDLCLLTVQQIERSFRKRRLARYPAAAWISSAWSSSGAYVQEHIKDLAQFTSMVTLTYRVVA